MKITQQAAYFPTYPKPGGSAKREKHDSRASIFREQYLKLTIEVLHSTLIKI
jgi:hypothetical protein